MESKNKEYLLLNNDLHIKDIDEIKGYLKCIKDLIEYFKKNIDKNKEVNVADLINRLKDTSDYLISHLHIYKTNQIA